VPLLYVQWHAPVRDVTAARWDESQAAAFYRPLLSFLSRQPGPPFRVEIPFTAFHWEALEIAPHFPIARGWERQLDVHYNHLFYGGRLTPATYEAWLHELAVRYVAVPHASFDYSAVEEVAMINRGLPYLRLVMHTPNWRVYEVLGATPIVEGPARLRAIGANSLTLDSTRPGTSFVRVRFTPYWAITEGSGCVAPENGFTEVTLRRPGVAKLGISFSLGRIRATSSRCN
jgi:hypothetical protein